MSAEDDLLPLPPGVSGLFRVGDPVLPVRPLSEARRVVAAMLGPRAITFEPAEEVPIARSFHDVRVSLRRGRETDRARVLVHLFVPWIAFASDAPRSSLSLAFVPMPAHASPPPAPYVVVPLSMLERPVEPAMLTEHGPERPAFLASDSRVGDLVFNFED